MNLAFIPVRIGSKGIPKKNIKLFCKKPLIYWTLKAASDSTIIDKVIIASDSEEINSTVTSFNLPKVEIFKRSSLNASDTSSTESVLLEFIAQSKLNTEDNICLIQATSPYVTATDIVSIFKQYEESNVESVLSCAVFKRFFWNKEGKSINYNYLQRPRRQDFEGVLIENGALYLNKVNNIVKTKNRLTEPIGIFTMPEHTHFELDEPDDWVYAESIMNRFFNRITVQNKIELVVSDVDGVLTDSGMYYSNEGIELKKFNTQDGMGFELLRNAGLKTAIITSEDTKIVERRAKKLKVDFLFQGKAFGGKLETIQELSKKIGIPMASIAYIGDDINCYELLNSVGFAACPRNAQKKIKSIRNIKVLNSKGGEGAFREFAELILNK